MKRIIILLLIAFWAGSVIGQTDKNGNPVFNSISTSETSYEDFLLIGNYYTLKNNIDNKNSSFYISDNPTLDQVEKSAISLPSDFYILTKENKMIVTVLLQNDPQREFMFIVIKTNQKSSYPCNLKGDITENRAVEIRQKFDSTAIIENNILKFNGKEFKIISNKEIEEAVWGLIKKEKLDKKKPSNVILLSKKEIEAYMLSETKEGGKLDFFTEIKGHEYDGVQIKPGVFTTKQGIALYKWGRACFELGVNTVEDAYEIFSKFKGKPINGRDKEYIRMGFDKELEK